MVKLFVLQKRTRYDIPVIVPTECGKKYLEVHPLKAKRMSKVLRKQGYIVIIIN